MEFKRWVGVLSTVFLLGCETTRRPSQEVDARTEELLRTYSLTQLDQVATYVTELVVAGVNAAPRTKIKKVLACDPKAGVPETWMMPLKSLIDSKMSRDLELYLKMPLEQRLKFGADCEATCSCGADGTLLQGIDEAQLKPEEIALRDHLLKKQGELSDKATLACARQVPWFCTSPLLKYLQTSAP